MRCEVSTILRIRFKGSQNIKLWELAYLLGGGTSDSVDSINDIKLLQLIFGRQFLVRFGLFLKNGLKVFPQCIVYMNNTLKSMRKIPIENVLLPKYVEVAKKQIRMFEREGEVLSSEYTNLFKKGEVVPNSTKDNGEGKVTVLVTKIKIPTAINHQLTPKFIKAYREGRVITRLPVGILKIPKDPSKAGGSKKNVKINRELFGNVLNKMKTNKELMKEVKEFLDLTRDNDKFHTITIKYKTFKYDTNGVKTEERWSTLNTVFSAPVLRAFIVV